MRADMFKVIVERPRRGGAGQAPSVKLKRCRDRDLKFIGLRRHALTEAPYCKSLNENLVPLVGFLRSRRGRRWDDVFSEICAHLDTGSTAKMHVRRQVEDLVMVRITRGRHGEWMHGGRVLRPEHLRWRWRHLCVDPDDGILKDVAALRSRIAKAPTAKGASR